MAVRTIVSAVQSKIVVEPPAGAAAAASAASRKRPTAAAAAAAALPKVLSPPLSRGVGHMAGMGVGQYVYSECAVWFNVRVGERSSERLDAGGQADTVLQVLRAHPSLPLKDGAFARPLTAADYTKVYESEPKEHSASPEYRHFVLSMKELCTGNMLCPLLIRLCHAGASRELIGEFSVDLYTLLVKGPSGDSRYLLINPAKALNKRSSYKDSGTLSCKTKLLSKFELTSKDPALIEELVCRAPFLLGWQPGLELKSIQQQASASAKSKMQIAHTKTIANGGASAAALSHDAKMREHGMNNAMALVKTQAGKPSPRNKK